MFDDCIYVFFLLKENGIILVFYLSKKLYKRNTVNGNSSKLFIKEK
jgi:hypothetical protein